MFAACKLLPKLANEIYTKPSTDNPYLLTLGSILGCGVAQIVVRRRAVRQALVRFPARHPCDSDLHLIKTVCLNR